MFNPFSKVVKLLVTTSLFASACTDPAVEPAPTSGGSGTPYTVTGTVVDTQGNPIAGAKVRANNDVLYGSAEVITDANGHYTMPKLELGGWKIYAWKDVIYKGKNYRLRMGMPQPSDYNAFSPGKEGVVKNFRWQLSGEIPDRPRNDNSSSGYFGGTLRFNSFDANFHSLPKGMQITVTLTPVAGSVRFDGSAAQVFKKTFTIESESQYNYMVYDIPQAEYRITAESLYNGVKRPVYLGENMSAYAPAIEGFYFLSSGTGSYESGLAGPENGPFYMQVK